MIATFPMTCGGRYYVGTDMSVNGAVGPTRNGILPILGISNYTISSTMRRAAGI
jgi:hypothetical protein